MRYCSTCGTPLQPGMTHCPRCASIVLPPPQSMPNSNATPGPQRPPVAATSYPTPVAQQAPSPVAGYYGTYSANTNQAAPYYSPPPTFKPPLTQKPRAGLGRGATTFLVILALLTMCSGIALIYYTTTARPSQFRAQATATVQTILTAQSQATTTIKNQAHATATAQAQVTATAVAKAQALLNIYTTATSGTPVLSSSLAARDNTNWDTYDAIGGGGCSFNNNALHASTFQNNTYIPCFVQGSNFGDFAFQVNMTILQGDGGGLIFRANDAASKFYLLRISLSGVFSIYASLDSKTSTPILDDTSSTIKTGTQANLITLIARKSDISIYINKQFAGTINDATYSTGEIGVVAYDHSKKTDVAFTDANVWAL